MQFLSCACVCACYVDTQRRVYNHIQILSPTFYGTSQLVSTQATHYLGPAENGMNACDDRFLEFSGVKRRGSNSWDGRYNGYDQL